MAPRGPTLRVRFDSFELDEADARLRRDEIPVPLPPKAFAVLCTLVRQPGVLVTKNDLLDAVWGHQHVSESVLKTTISSLRAALADDPKQPKYIETASRRGYRFIGNPSSTPTSVGSGAQARAHTPLAPDLRSPELELSPGIGVSDTAQRPRLVGRQAALARLREAWRKAQAGQRQLVWIAGEAGVGKTRLIESFISELEPGAATYGQCVEHFGTGEPYLPILEAIKELCRREPALLPAMRAVAPTWLVQMPWLVSESERADLHREVAGAHQDRMVREMRELMDRYTAKRPLVFVLEDLHWSDHGTLRMMEHFARRPREVRLLWIASFRLTQVIAEDHPLRDLRQELRLHKLCDEILLEPFSEAEVAAYMDDRLAGRQIPEDFVRRLHAHTDGLPLYVANVADSLISQSGAEGQAMEWLDAASTAPLPVPDSLTGVIEKQLGRLPAEVQALLEAASVCGMEFRAGIVAQMLERDPRWVSERCDDLVKRQFWLRHVDIVELPDGGFDTRYSFLHALYTHVLYRRLLMPQRVHLHRQAAKALEATTDLAQGATAAELASHHERGHQFLHALRCYGRAAELAVGHFAPMEAINITGNALELLDRCADGVPRMEAELNLVHKRAIACAQLLGIGSTETVSAFRRARTLCDSLPETPHRALLMNGMGLTYYVQGEYAQSRAIAERVLASSERYGDLILRVCALLLRGMIEAMQAEHDAACASLEGGILAAQELGDRIPFAQFVVDPFVALRANLAVPLMHLGKAEQARMQVDSALERARQLGQPTAIMLALWVGGMLALRRGEPHTVAEIAQTLGKLVEESMLTQADGPANWLRGWAEMHLGAPRDGFKRIRAGYESHARLGMFAGNTEVLGHAAEAMLMAGDLPEAERQLDEAFALARRINEHPEVPNFMLLRARVAQARGEQPAALDSIRAALAESRSRRSPYWELKALVALCERPDVTAEDRDALRRVYSSLPEIRETAVARRAETLMSGAGSDLDGAAANA